MANITEQSLNLFLALARDAGNWSGTPLFGGNVGNAKADKGNLIQLKKEGLLKTEQDGACAWVYFTSQGIALAARHGVEISG